MSTTTRSGFLAAPPPAPRLPDAEVERLYPRLRLQVFLGIFIGYSSYYLIRNNIPLVAKLLQSDYGYTKSTLGVVTNVLLVSYGLSKFFSAIRSDRSNARIFLPMGLALSALANFVIAFVPSVGASVALLSIVMMFNGWFQGMGWPPCGRTLVYWFSPTERGTKGAWWNVAHNVGGALSSFIAAWAVDHSGKDWHAAFWMPSVLCLVLAVVTFFLMRDTPASVGLPPIEEYRHDPTPAAVEVAEDTSLSQWDIIREHILRSRVMVCLALANVFVYALRYGILVWAPVYLADVRHASFTKSVAGFGFFELAGIPGMLIAGYVSDKIFRGRKSPAGMFFLAGTAVMIAVYWLLPQGTPLGVLYGCLVAIGALIYGPVMLIGLQALDLAPRHVAGTAAGFTGLFGYVLGATMASSGVGLLVDHLGWGPTFSILIAMAFAGIAFLTVVNRREHELAATR